MTAASDISREIRVVALPLGPYRNLTTLLAATLASHPQCVVLNHAAERLLALPENDIFASGGLDALLPAALAECEGGARGNHGGDVRLSHAFDDASVASLYAKYKGDSVLTENVRTFLWKDSMRFTNRMRHIGMTPSMLASRDSRYRFVLPIRNPLDCAQSSLKGKFRFLTDDPHPSKLHLVDKILDVVRWVRSDVGPVFVFTEVELGRDWLVNLCSFLGLEAYPDWIADVLDVVTVRKNYSHSTEEVRAYRELVEAKFDTDPEMRERLCVFC